MAGRPAAALNGSSGGKLTNPIAVFLGGYRPSGWVHCFKLLRVPLWKAAPLSSSRLKVWPVAILQLGLQLHLQLNPV
jgi:hypothetical protein